MISEINHLFIQFIEVSTTVKCIAAKFFWLFFFQLYHDQPKLLYL